MNSPPAPRRPDRAGAGPAITAYVVGVFAAAALGAPWLYRLARLAAAHAPAALAPPLASLAAHPLHRYLQRLLLVFALAGLPALLRVLGLRRWRDVGLGRPWAHRRALALGALAGAATLLAAAAVPIAVGARVLAPDLTVGRVVARALTALAVAPVVALLEEVLFRGVIDGGLRRAGAGPAALAAGSAFYAGVHFLGHAGTPPALSWHSGLDVLGGMLPRLGEVGAVAPAFFTLWLVGAYLGALYARAGTLLSAVGVHAGGVVVIQLYGLVTAGAPDADPRLWGSGWLVDGWAALVVLGGARGLAWVCRGRRAAVVEAAEPAAA